MVLFGHLTVFRNRGKRFDYLNQGGWGKWTGLSIGPLTIIYTPWTISS